MPWVCILISHYFVMSMYWDLLVCHENKFDFFSMNINQLVGIQHFHYDKAVLAQKCQQYVYFLVVQPFSHLVALMDSCATFFQFLEGWCYSWLVVIHEVIFQEFGVSANNNILISNIIEILSFRFPMIPFKQSNLCSITQLVGFLIQNVC